MRKERDILLRFVDMAENLEWIQNPESFWEFDVNSPVSLISLL